MDAAALNAVERIATIAILLGLVIIVHELGHFLVARWAGVLVERFSVGFGPVLFSIKRGETEYALSAIPLGGYVKMLGQSDTPDVVEQSDDQRSYQNKSVGARMAIISAGVVMNVIFGFACFVLAYHLGVEYQPAVVGSTIPALPAWKAGLRAGDDVVSINGHEPTDYETLMMEVALTRPPRQHVELKVDRGSEKLEFSIAPVLEQGKPKPVIGVLPSLGLELPPETPTLKNTPAGRAANPGFEPEDTIVALDGVELNSHRRLVDLLYAKQTETVAFKVRRKKENKDAPAKEAVVKVEPNFVRTLGLVMQIGPVVATQAGSPAEKAVDAEGKPSPILPKDVVKAVEGNVDFDPMRLSDLLSARAGRKTELTLLRPGREQTELKVYVTPLPIPPWVDFPAQIPSLEAQPMSVPSIGLAYSVLPAVRKVEPGGPAATASTPLEPNDVVKSVVVYQDVKGKEKPTKLDVKEDHWPAICWTLQFPDVVKVSLVVQRAAKPGPLATIETTLTPAPDKTWPLANRGLLFLYDSKERRVDGILAAVELGVERTRSSIIRLYLFLRGLVMRTISPNLLAGPVTIAHTAYLLADNFPMLILFIGLLNINLAVINFLPIPVLDGGHMVFLLIELVTRRKPNERLLHLATYAGFVFIVLLMAFVFGQDIWRYMKPS